MIGGYDIVFVVIRGDVKNGVFFAFLGVNFGIFGAIRGGGGGVGGILRSRGGGSSVGGCL